MSTSKHPPLLTATITGRGEDSTIPDCADAVDADIYVGDSFLCGVTLAPPLDGRPGLKTLGSSADHWCSDFAAIEDIAAERGVDTREIIGEIEVLVTEADRKAGA